MRRRGRCIRPLGHRGQLNLRRDGGVVEGEIARSARVRARDGVDEASVVQRMRAQIDPAEARRRATYVIANDADLATLRERANAVYDRLLGD